MSRIKIPLSEDGQAEIEIIPESGQIYVHSRGQTALRLVVQGSLDRPIDAGRNFVDARVAFTDHVQITLGPGSVVES